jgi:hypothetical protein
MTENEKRDEELDVNDSQHQENKDTPSTESDDEVVDMDEEIEKESEELTK